MRAIKANDPTPFWSIQFQAFASPSPKRHPAISTIHQAIMSSKPQVTFASKHQMLPIKRAASAPQTSTFSKSDTSNQSILPVTQASPISSDAKFLQSYHFQETHMEDRTETHIDSTHPDSKVDEADLPLLSQNSLLSPSSDITDLALTTPSPSKSTFSRLSIDEEKVPPASLLSSLTS